MIQTQVSTTPTPTGRVQKEVHTLTNGDVWTVTRTYGAQGSYKATVTRRSGTQETRSNLRAMRAAIYTS